MGNNKHVSCPCVARSRLCGRFVLCPCGRPRCCTWFGAECLRYHRLAHQEEGDSSEGSRPMWFLLGFLRDRGCGDSLVDGWQFTRDSRSSATHLMRQEGLGLQWRRYPFCIQVHRKGGWPGHREGLPLQVWKVGQVWQVRHQEEDEEGCLNQGLHLCHHP